MKNEDKKISQRSKINKEPFKVLDAPSFKDDFYLHLLDWSDKNLLAVGLSRELYLWDSQKSTSQLSYSSDCDTYISSVKWIEGSDSLLIGTSQGKILLWDIVKRKVFQEFLGHNKRIGVIASKNANFFSTGSQDNCIINYDTRQKKSVSTYDLHTQEVCGLKWSCEGNYLASGGNDNKLIIWSQHKDTYLKKFSQHKSAIKALDWSPHRYGLLASGGGTQDRSIKFWNISNLSLVESIETNSQVCNLKFDPFSNKIITTHGFSENLSVIWNYPNLEIVEILKGHRERVIYLACSPDGKNIATGAGDETIRLWKINKDEQPSQKIPLQEDQFCAKIR